MRRLLLLNFPRFLRPQKQNFDVFCSNVFRNNEQVTKTRKYFINIFIKLTGLCNNKAGPHCHRSNLVLDTYSLLDISSTVIYGVALYWFFLQRTLHDLITPNEDC